MNPLSRREPDRQQQLEDRKARYEIETASKDLQTILRKIRDRLDASEAALVDVQVRDFCSTVTRRFQQSSLSREEVVKLLAPVAKLIEPLCQLAGSHPTGSTASEKHLNSVLRLTVALANFGLQPDTRVVSDCLQLLSEPQRSVYLKMFDLAQKTSQKSASGKLGRNDILSRNDVPFFISYFSDLSERKVEPPRPNKDTLSFSFLGLQIYPVFQGKRQDDANADSYFELFPQEKTLLVGHFIPKLDMTNFKENPFYEAIYLDVLTDSYAALAVFLDWYGQQKKLQKVDVLIGTTNRRFGNLLSQLGFSLHDEPALHLKDDQVLALASIRSLRQKMKAGNAVLKRLEREAKRRELIKYSDDSQT